MSRTQCQSTHLWNGLSFPFLNFPQATWSGPVLGSDWTAILLSEPPLSSSSLVEALMISSPDLWCHLPPPLAPCASHATHITGPIFPFCHPHQPQPRNLKWLSSLLIKTSTNDSRSPTSISLHDKASFMPSQWASLVAQMVKNPLAMHKTWVRSLGWEDPLDKGTATHSSILTWRVPWTEEPGGLHSWAHKESDTTEWLILSLSCRLSSPTCLSKWNALPNLYTS